MEMVLNELSLRHSAPDIPTARQWMSELIATIRSVKKQSTHSISLRTQYDFHATQIAPNYPLRRWLNDQEVDREERRFIKVLATKSPFSNEVTKPEIQDLENNQGNYEYRHQGETAIGLGVASLLDLLPVSLLSEPCWDCSRLTVEVTGIDDDDETIIVHASRSSHVREHADWIQSCTQVKVRDGIDLWHCKEDLFPHLQFCNAVEKQLQTLLANDPMLRAVKRRLLDLENYSNNWSSGAFDLNTLPSKATPESDSRLKQFKKELTFDCPDGESRLFSLHVRMTPGAWRLYFYPDLGPGQLIIGYIGPKLQ
jgi:hypothetical protein